MKGTIFYKLRELQHNSIAPNFFPITGSLSDLHFIQRTASQQLYYGESQDFFLNQVVHGFFLFLNLVALFLFCFSFFFFLGKLLKLHKETSSSTLHILCVHIFILITSRHTLMIESQ